MCSAQQAKKLVLQICAQVLPGSWEEGTFTAIRLRANFVLVIVRSIFYVWHCYNLYTEVWSSDTVEHDIIIEKCELQLGFIQHRFYSLFWQLCLSTFLTIVTHRYQQCLCEGELWLNPLARET